MQQIHRLLFCALLTFAFPTYADDVHVAVASNFTSTFAKLVEVFESQSPHRIKTSSGSSGKIFAQIQHGAPFDVFLSADHDKPLRLIESQLAVANSRFTYAFGALVLWSTADSYAGQHEKQLISEKFNKLALANPTLAPYGMAAQEVLKRLRMYKRLKGKQVQGENISQTYQFISTGNADLGFVALSQVLHSQPKSSYWTVPSHLYKPIRQDAVLLSRAAESPAAQAFLNFLHTPEAKKIIAFHGYRTP